MNNRPTVVVFNKKSDAIKRHHPWIFSGAIRKMVGKVEEGSVVDVQDENGEFLAVGHYSPGSIAVRVFSFEPFEDIQQFLQQKFASAWSVRVLADLVDNATTNVFRLINAEGDGMPGLVVDFYNGTAVLQAHSRGMHQLRNEIVEAMKIVLGSKLKCVYDKSAAVLDKKSSSVADTSGSNYLLGTKGDDIVLENGNQFQIDWETGQKTGFFIDQRDNRALLGKFSKNKKVLNTFCYSGGFSVYALSAGASEVHSTDSSAKAIELTNNNVALNKLDEVRHKSTTADIFDFLRTAYNDYDVIVLDPPAFAKNQNARHQAVQAYKRLNAAAFEKVKQGGVIFTFSCSQAVSPEFFNGAVMAAAIESRRNIRILHHLTQPADHPISIFHPEGLYLKGLVLQVD